MSLLLDLIDSQNNAKPAPRAIAPTGSLLLDSINKLPAAAPDDGVPPSPVAQLPVDPIDAQIARNNAFKSRVDGILAPPPNAFEAANQATQQADTSNNIENAMAMQPAPSAMVAPVQLGRDGVNPVSVFNPLPVDNAQIVQNEMSAIEQQPMATQERADAGLFNPNRDFGRSVEFGRDTAQSNVKNLVADTEDVLRETAPMQMMQTMQNAALPVVNPIRELFGAAPLPENANEKASIAAAAAARQDATRLMDQAKAMGYRQMTTDDIDNFGDFLDWAKTSLGSSGEPMLVSLATGGWMSPLLMAGEYNTNLKEIKGLSKEKRLALASSGGLVAGFLENVGLGILIKGMPKELVGKLGGKWFVEKVSKHFGGRLAAALLTGMVSEGLVEVGQEGIGIGLEASVGKNFGKGEIWNRVKQSGAAGAVVGGGIRVGVQSGTEAVGGVQSAITPDPLLTDNEKTVAGFIASDLLNPANAQLTEVKTEGEPTGSLLLDAIQRAEEFATPAQAAEAAPVVEPVVEQPVVEQPIVEPAVEPVVEPAVEPVVEPAVEPVVEQPVVEPAVEPVVEPTAAEPAPAAEPDNPQAKPVIPFARPVSDTDGQQKTVSIATPDNEVTVQAKPVILDAADLKAATGNLQPRDRSLNESAVEVQRRAANLDPARLLDSPTSDNGAPIVARDGTIISGNGRVLSLRAVYEQFPEQAAAYKQAIAEYGASDANYDNPVLVMMIDQDMSFEQLADFADRSNRSAIATMSATERAQRDAQAMDIGMVNMFQGGSMTAIENQGFVQQFMRGVVSPTEQNTMSRDGRLTKEGVQRMESAILATAYEDTDALAIMLDSTDDNIKAISRAMLDAAPRFAKLKADIASGEVDSQFDISAKVTEAARKISDLRNRGVKPRDFFAQQDAFNQVDPDVEALIRAFYNEDLTRAKSQRIMSDVLKFYTEEAAQKKQGGFFEDTTTPRDVIELARRKADGTEGQGDLLADTEQRPSRSLNESGQQTQRAAPKRSGQGLKEADTAPIKARLDDAERPSRAEVASEETVGATEDTVVAISELDSFKTQKPGTLVYRESMREGSARYMQAFQDLGLDYNKAISLPIENQFRLLSQAMVKKFGFAAVVKTDNANAKEAVDQLLVGYHNMNDMAYRLGLPAEAMGLEGTLSFVLANKRKFFGQYDPNTRSITLPKRSNSFAHEWFHALDHYLLEKYGSGLSTQVPLVSAAVRAHGTEAFAPDAPTGVKDSYYALMRALFKDKATEAMQLKAINQKMSEMEARAAKAGKSVSEMKSYQQLQNQKENILASIGKSKRVLKTDYRTNAEFFNALEGRKKEYYGTPAEMAARAFESYAIRQLVNEGLATEGMGKSQAAYDMTFEQLGVTKEELANGLAGYAKMSDSRLALTFPKGQEQVEINGAFTNLMDAIRLETELGKGEVASPTSTENIIDRRAMLNVPEREKGSFRAEQKKAKREAKLETDRVEKRIDQYGNRYKGFKKAVVVVEDAVLSPALYQKQTTLRSLIKRYPANTNLRRIYENLGTHTGGVYQSTVEGDNLANAEARQIRFFSLMLKGLFDKYDIKSMDDAELNMLRMVLTGQDTLDGAPDRVVKAAGEIRDMYNQLYDYMNSAGMEIGYARSGYIPRMLDLPNVFADETKFKSQAEKVYKIVWNEELGDTPNLSNPDIMFDTIKFIQTAKLSISELNVDGQRKSLGNSDTYQDFIKSELWQEVVDADKSLKALLRKKENDPSAVKDSEIDEARQRLQEASDFVAPEFDAFFNEMRDMFADYRSKNWLEAIQDNQSVDPAAASPQAVFSKQRELPPEADALLEDFYYQNPIDSLTSYMMAAVRKAEYNRRFGKQNMPDVANKNNYVDYLDYLIGKSGADSANGGFPDGVRLSTSEVKLLRETVNFVTGRKDSMSATMGTKAVNRATALLSMTLLIRAPISSIAEPFTVAMTSGSVVKGLHSFGMVMNELPGLRNLSKNAAEDIRLRHQFARIMGVIDDPSVSDVIMSRIGGEFNGDENLQRFLSNFFQKIQLTGITNAQRRAAARIGFQFMTEMAYEIRNPSSARNAKRAQLTLNDLGVSDGRMDQFIDYLLTLNNMNAKGKVDGKLKLPTIDQVVDENATYTDMGLQLAVSVMRFTDQSIQDPRRADRPKWAEYPAGKFVYGITSFIRSFHDKVLMGSIRKVQREARISRELGASKSRARADATAYAAAKIAAPMFTFFMAHALVSTAREYLLNQDRWDREWEESDEDALKFMRGYLFQNAFSRSGLTGAFDPLYQAWTSLKYQRDLSNILVGTAGYITQELDNAVGYFSDRNSPNTVSSEFKAYRAIWNLIAQPLISYTFAKTPMADALKLPAYGLTAGATSTTVKNYLINEIVHLLHGQRYEPGQRGRKSKSKNYTNK